MFVFNLVIHVKNSIKKQQCKNATKFEQQQKTIFLYVCCVYTNPKGKQHNTQIKKKKNFSR